MCIGNREGGDDAIGPYIADKLKDSDIKVIDCGTVPENHTGAVKKYNPNNLVIVDAADMGLKSGEIRIIPKDKIGVMHVSTHGIPVSVLINYLEKYVKNIIFIGIQPNIMSGRLTKTLKKSGDKIVEIIKNHKFELIEILD
jgi:hydrogenase 3 maturation protease